eukprot:TRINITY_DN16483_c0_g1_i1.p1 TRINITY_DN16483_c0_g1~~TRINITY_DN16483_c0_g1_i1.p1  ORF type:complete len:397 (+),score=81.72 TRINITY_DN16483_c0_g1_i1:213-1403(+)
MDKGMEEKLLLILEQAGLQKYEPALLKLGVRMLEDVEVLSDGDLQGAGMSVVELRRFQQATRGVLAQCLDHEAVGSPSESPRKLLAVPLAREASKGGAAERSHSPTGTHLMVPLAREQSKVRRRASPFWTSQGQRPRRLIFVRHGESEANVNRKITATVPDHVLHLTAKGRQQAIDAGKILKDLMGDESVKFVYSPYVRTRETLNGILQSWNDSPVKPTCREDVRIREQEYGNYDSPDIKSYHKEKKEFGPFYYRFLGGESPADCYDRASSFIESLYRSWLDNQSANLVIVSHGMMILVILMRLFRIPIDEFDTLDSLKNCELVVCERPEDDTKFGITYTWPQGESQNRGGLRRKPSNLRELKVWSGDPSAPLVESIAAEEAAAANSEGKSGYPKA